MPVSHCVTPCRGVLLCRIEAASRSMCHIVLQIMPTHASRFNIRDALRRFRNPLSHSLIAHHKGKNSAHTRYSQNNWHITCLNNTARLKLWFWESGGSGSSLNQGENRALDSKASSRSGRAPLPSAFLHRCRAGKRWSRCLLMRDPTAWLDQ